MTYSYCLTMSSSTIHQQYIVDCFKTGYFSDSYNLEKQAFRLKIRSSIRSVWCQLHRKIHNDSIPTHEPCTAILQWQFVSGWPMTTYHQWPTCGQHVAGMSPTCGCRLAWMTNLRPTVLHSMLDSSKTLPKAENDESSKIIFWAWRLRTLYVQAFTDCRLRHYAT